jgi:hypothetical protein
MTYLKIGSLLILLIAKSTAYSQNGTVTLSRYHVISLINDALRLDACDSLVVALQADNQYLYHYAQLPAPRSKTPLAEPPRVSPF